MTRATIQVVVILFSAITLLAASSGMSAMDTARLKLAVRKLQPLHQKMQPPGPMDWLSHHDEPGQTFDQYVKSRPVTPQGKRNTLYIQPIGSFSATQRNIVTLTAEYMAIYFNVNVKTNAPLPLASIPSKARRTHPQWGDKQILTTYVLDRVLKPKLPEDAAAMIALTTSDLWPGQGWNFVFGQASIRERVGVWSIYRNGDPGKDEESFKLCLKRTMQTAVHETGHMFSMRHCTAYECCMCGSNNRAESDRRPVYLCPECVAKVCWATQTDPVARYQRLKTFCEQQGFEKDRAFFEKAIRKLDA